MANPDDFLYEYAVVRYVPRIDREEFVNIGLLMLCKRQKWMKGYIILDDRRLRSFDPNVNLDRLLEQSAVFERDDVPKKDLPAEERYRWLTAVKSAMLQVSPSHPGIIADGHSKCQSRAITVSEVLEEEFRRLVRQLVEA